MADLNTKEAIVSLYEMIVDLHVETQTILQLMVLKANISPEDVQLMRETVRKNSKTIKTLQHGLDMMRESIDKQERHVDLFKRMANLTDEEKAELKKVLDNEQDAANLFTNAGIMK